MIKLSSGFKKTIYTSGINFIFRLFGLAISFICTLVISKFFGFTTFGNYSLIFALSQTIALLFCLGIPNSLIQIIGNTLLNEDQSKALLKTGLKTTLVISIIPVVVLFFGKNFISYYFFNNIGLSNYFLTAAYSIPFLIVHEVMLFYFLATKKFMPYNFCMFVLPNLLFITFLVIAKYLQLGGFWVFLSFTAGVCITVVVELGIVFFKKYKPFPAVTQPRKLLKIASPMLISGFFLMLLTHINVIMLGILTTEKQVGIYSIAAKVANLGFLIIVSISTIISPKMAELYGRKDMSGFKILINNSTRLISLLTLPIVAIIIIFSSDILQLWGKEATQGSLALIIISVGVLISAVFGNVDQILNMSNNQHILQNITVCSLLVNVAFNFVLIPKYGIEGAAISSLITNISINVLCLYFIKAKLGFYTLF